MLLGTGGAARSRHHVADSTVDPAPVVELRQAAGTLVQTLSRGSFDALVAELKWTLPLAPYFGEHLRPDTWREARSVRTDSRDLMMDARLHR